MSFHGVAVAQVRQSASTSLSGAASLVKLLRLHFVPRRPMRAPCAPVAQVRRSASISFSGAVCPVKLKIASWCHAD